MNIWKLAIPKLKQKLLLINWSTYCIFDCVSSFLSAAQLLTDILFPLLWAPSPTKD